MHARAAAIATFPFECAVLTSTWVVWARERQAPGKPDESGIEKQEGEAVRLESRARATTNLWAKSERARPWNA